jgi:hypothetical protein
LVAISTLVLRRKILAVLVILIQRIVIRACSAGLDTACCSAVVDTKGENPSKTGFKKNFRKSKKTIDGIYWLWDIGFVPNRIRFCLITKNHHYERHRNNSTV